MRQSKDQRRRLGVAAALVDGEIVEGDVEIERDRIMAVGLGRPGRGLAIPALVDLQINGYAGVDFSGGSPDDYRRAERTMLADGVGAYQPTVITAPEANLLAALGRSSRAIAAWAPGGARPIGIHLEGPFFSPALPGIHPPGAIRNPDLGLTQRLLDAGPISFLTLAPELPGALELIRWLCERGVTVSCGHTNATYAEAVAGFDAGATSVTHLFNCMRPLGHRDPGILSAALLREDVSIGLIADHDHIAPEVLEIVRRIAGDRICLVTDATAPAQAPDGVYPVGDVEVTRLNGKARRSDGRIGGSVTPLLECVRKFIEAGAPLVWAVRAASAVPANLVGRPDLGRLAVGGPADIVVVDDSFQLQSVLAHGVETGDG